jgi:hypothetical protein
MDVEHYVLAVAECLQNLAQAQQVDKLMVEGCYLLWCKLLLEHYEVKQLPLKLPHPPVAVCAQVHCKGCAALRVVPCVQALSVCVHACA